MTLDREALDTAVLWGCGLGLGGVALAALALGLSNCPARVRAAAKRLGCPTVFVLGGFMAFATLEGSVTRAHKERCAESAGCVSATPNVCAKETQSVSEGRSQSDSERSELPARAREGTENQPRISRIYTDWKRGCPRIFTNRREAQSVKIRVNPWTKLQQAEKNLRASPPPIPPCLATATSVSVA